MRALVVAGLIAFFLQSQPLPSGPLAMRDFRLQFDPAGTFTLGGDRGWPPMAGKWTITGAEINLQNDPGPSKCDGAARYTFVVDGSTVGFDLIADDCQARRMILDRSRWAPPGMVAAPAARRIVLTAGPAKGPLPMRPLQAGLPAVALAEAGDWPSFRGR